MDRINDVSSNEGFQVASILASVYRNGNRNDIIFALSGFLRHGGYSLDATETIVNQLCQMTGDEEIENRLVVVRKTYKKANDGKPITGRNELFEILERAVRLRNCEPNHKWYFTIVRQKTRSSGISVRQQCSQ